MAEDLSKYGYLRAWEWWQPKPRGRGRRYEEPGGWGRAQAKAAAAGFSSVEEWEAAGWPHPQDPETGRPYEGYKIDRMERGRHPTGRRMEDADWFDIKTQRIFDYLQGAQVYSPHYDWAKEMRARYPQYPMPGINMDDLLAQMFPEWFDGEAPGEVAARVGAPPLEEPVDILPEEVGVAQRIAQWRQVRKRAEERAFRRGLPVSPPTEEEREEQRRAIREREIARRALGPEWAGYIEREEKKKTTWGRYLKPTARPAVMGLAPQPTPEEQRESLAKAMRGIWESLPVRGVRRVVGAGIAGLQQVAYGYERAQGEIEMRLPFGWGRARTRVETTLEQLEAARAKEEGRQYTARTLDNLLEGLDAPTREFVTHSIARISHSGLTSQFPAGEEIAELKRREPDISLGDPRITTILAEYENPALEIIGQIVFDPLNYIGLGFGKLREIRGTQAIIADFATAAGDDAAKLVGEIPDARPLVEALNPLGQTRTSQARAAVVNTYDLVHNAIAGLDEPGEITRILTQWAQDPTKLPAELGVSPQSRAGRVAQQLLKRLELPSFQSLQPGKFSLLDFLVELEDNLTWLADPLYKVEGDKLPGVLGDYQRFTRAVKNYASDIYLGMNPGYVWRNAYNNFVTTAIDGVHTFDRAEEVGRFYERLGVKLLRAEEGIGSAELFRGAEDISEIPAFLRPFRRLGNIGHGVATGQTPLIGEGWYRLRANYTATRRFLGRYWRPGGAIPDIPEELAGKLGPETLRMVQAGIEQGMSKDEFLRVIGRLFDDTPGINVGTYLDDVEDVSPELLRRVQEIVDGYDPGKFAGQMDDLINDVTEWDTRAWKFEGWQRLPNGEWAYDSGPFNIQDTPYLFRQQVGELANRVGLHEEGAHYARRVNQIARDLGLPGAVSEEKVVEAVAAIDQEIGELAALSEVLTDDLAQYPSSQTVFRFYDYRHGTMRKVTEPSGRLVDFEYSQVVQEIAHEVYGFEASPQGAEEFGRLIRRRVEVSRELDDVMNGLKDLQTAPAPEVVEAVEPAAGIFRWGQLPAEGKRLYWNAMIEDASSKGIPLPGYLYPFERSEIPQMLMKMGEPMTDGRGISYGHAVTASTEKELEFLGRVFDGVPQDIGTAKGPGAVKGGFLAWANGQVVPAWNDARLVALKYGEGAADFALLNYNKRQNLDTWFSLIYPYHYWYTRTGRNWAARAFTKPWALTGYARYKKYIEKRNEELPRRLQTSIGVPAGAMKPWMGDTLFVDASRAIWPFLNVWPWSILLGYDWDNDDEALGALGEVYNLQQNFQMRPYFFIDLATRLSGQLGERGKRETYYLAPQTAGIKGTSAVLREAFPQLLEGVIPPGGWNIEEGIRERMGLPRATWADEPYWTYMAITEMAAEGEITYQEGLEALHDAVMNGNTERNPIYQEALQRAGVRKGIGQMTSFWLGQPVNIYPVGEEERRRVQAELAEAGWAPERPEGTKAARTEIYERYPEYGLVAPARAAALGRPEQLERAQRYQEYNTQREKIESTFTPIKASLLGEGIGPGFYGYEIIDDLEGQATGELSEEFSGLFGTRSLYGASPGEAVAEQQRRLLSALSTAYYFIKPEEFADQEGMIDWGAFYKAREEFVSNPPIDAVTGPERWPYAQTLTSEMLAQYLVRNDTPEEALMRMVTERVYRPASDVVYDPEATQMEKQLAIHNAHATEREEVIEMVLELHPEWGTEEIQAMLDYALPTFAQWQRRNQDPKKAMAGAMRDFYFTLTQAERKTLHNPAFAEEMGVPGNYMGEEFRQFIKTTDHWKKTDDLSEEQIATWLRHMGVASQLVREEAIPVPGEELPPFLQGIEEHLRPPVEEPEARGRPPGMAAPTMPTGRAGPLVPETAPQPSPGEDGGISRLPADISAAYAEYLAAMSHYQELKDTEPDAARRFASQPQVAALFDRFAPETPGKAFWDFYWGQIPPGKIADDVRADPIIAALIDKGFRDVYEVKEGAYEQGLEILTAWREAHQEIPGNPQEWAVVRQIVGKYWQLRETGNDNEAKAIWRYFASLLGRYYPPKPRPVRRRPRQRYARPRPKPKTGLRAWGAWAGGKRWPSIRYYPSRSR